MMRVRGIKFSLLALLVCLGRYLHSFKYDEEDFVAHDGVAGTYIHSLVILNIYRY